MEMRFYECKKLPLQDRLQIGLIGVINKNVNCG